MIIYMKMNHPIYENVKKISAVEKHNNRYKNP